MSKVAKFHFTASNRRVGSISVMVIVHGPIIDHGRQIGMIMLQMLRFFILVPVWSCLVVFYSHYVDHCGCCMYPRGWQGLRNSLWIRTLDLVAFCLWHTRWQTRHQRDLLCFQTLWIERAAPNFSSLLAEKWQEKIFFFLHFLLAKEFKVDLKLKMIFPKFTDWISVFNYLFSFKLA